MSLLIIDKISKTYNNLTALQEFSLTVDQGEIIGIIEKGDLGRASLSNILSGEDKQYTGQIHFDGIQLAKIKQKQQAGIHQIEPQMELIDTLDTVQNLFLGIELRNWLRIPQHKQMYQRAAELFEELHFPAEMLHQRANQLTNEQRQLISLLRLRLLNRKLLILDNPIANVSPPYQLWFLHQLQRWKEEGSCIIFNSDSLENLFMVSDRILVLHEGGIIFDKMRSNTTHEEIISQLIDAEETQTCSFDVRRYTESITYPDDVVSLPYSQNKSGQALLTRLSEQVKEGRRVNHALQNAQRRLRTEREMERKRLAREIHDESIQDLLSINYQLAELIEEANTHPLAYSLEDIQEEIKDLVDGLRNICTNLRPPTIDTLGLPAAVHSFTSNWEDTYKIEAVVTIQKNLGRFAEDVELSIFRIIQEALSNVSKHSQASAVKVTLTHSKQTLVLTIADNGIGIPLTSDLTQLADNEHYGFLGMKERVSLLNGTMEYENLANGGLWLEFVIPVVQPPFSFS